MGDSISKQQYCPQHQNILIEYKCVEEFCGVPLCSQCIKKHQEIHRFLGTHAFIKKNCDIQSYKVPVCFISAQSFILQQTKRFIDRITHKNQNSQQELNKRILSKQFKSDFLKFLYHNLRNNGSELESSNFSRAEQTEER